MLDAALGSGAWAGSRAAQTAAFVRDFARFQGAAHGIALANGSVAIEAALVAAGVGEGDEVIVPAFTFVATAASVLRVNATPVIVDVDPETLCLDANAVARARSPRTRAVMTVHLGGAMADMDALLAYCTKERLVLLEDCAHAHGSAWDGRGAGSIGAAGTFSFQHSKLMTAGEGGALLSHDPELAMTAWQMANCGRDRAGGTYAHPMVGSNFRMTEWQGAVLSAQLRRYGGQLERRTHGAGVLARALSGVAGLSPQVRHARMTRHGYYAYILRIDPQVLGEGARDHLFARLTQAGVPLGLAYPSLTDLDVFKQANFAPSRRRGLDVIEQPTPVARSSAAHTLWIHHRVLLAADETLIRLADLIAETAHGIRRQG